MIKNAINIDHKSDKEIISDAKWMELYQLIGEQGLHSAFFVSLNCLYGLILGEELI